MPPGAREPAGMALVDRPIPSLRSPAGWHATPVEECGEPLVSLHGLRGRGVVGEPRYYLAGYAAASAEIYVRETVARLLGEAAATLPSGWRLVVFDGWRPLALQQQLYDQLAAARRIRQPEADERTLAREVQRYVARPSADPARPSPHATGGAVDLALLDAAGTLVPMGTELDAFDARSHTRYFEALLERRGSLGLLERTYLRNRRTLFHVLTHVGFTNYPDEWWHFDYGNQLWGRIKGSDARYGLMLAP